MAPFLAALLFFAPPELQPAVIQAAPDGPPLQATIDALPDGVPATIHLAPGTYPGQLIIRKPRAHLTLEADDPATTHITWDRNVRDPRPPGADAFNPGVHILADDFTARRITFENTSGNHGQALAIRADADRAAFDHCRIIGWQDTLMVNNGRDYFHDCYIAGRVDFIYGSATAVFDGCEIHSRNGGHITAASTPQDHPFGFVFLHCHLTGDATPWSTPPATQPDKVTPQADLGRPWRPYAAVAYIGCEMDAHIKPEGWNNWNKPDNEKTARYAEYRSTGPGAAADRRFSWTHQLTDDEAAAYTPSHVLAGPDHWQPFAAGAPATQAHRIRIVLVGDSTVAVQQGWGPAFAALFDPAKVEVTDLAANGRSSKSFRDEGKWEPALALHPDYVLIQFGHNDQPGKGPERETDPATTFPANLERYANEARAAGARPVILTSLTRRKFTDEHHIKGDLDDYAAAARHAAAETHTPLIDLYATSHTLCESMGRVQCEALSPRDATGKIDSTHLTPALAARIAPLVARDLTQLQPDLAAALIQPAAASQP